MPVALHMGRAGERVHQGTQTIEIMDGPEFIHMRQHGPDAGGLGLESIIAQERIEPDKPPGEAGEALDFRFQPAAAFPVEPVRHEQHHSALTQHPAGPFHIEAAQRLADPGAAVPILGGFGDMVVIGWQDEAQASHVPIALLEEVAAKGRVDDPADIPRNLWYNDHLPDIVRVSQQAVTDTNEGRARLSRALIEDGIAIVNDMEHSTESLPRLARAIGPITPSAEGLFFDVRVEIDPTNLAFTAGPLEMHTDLPGEETAPGVQFLHCLENTVEGGLSLFLDGAAVAEALRAEDPEALDRKSVV